MNQRVLQLPLSEADIKSLTAGDTVVLNGVMFTARDAAHKRFYESLLKNESLPVDLTTAAIYYAGPAPAKNGEIIGSCGPTTSARMDDHTPLLIERGLRVMIGKGKRSRSVTDAVKNHNAVYFAAVGGAGALYASRVKKCDIAAYPDLGCEAVYRLEVADFGVIVATDCRGNSILK